MDIFAKLISKVGGDDALNLINDQLTPLLLKSFRPKISEYVGTHVERTRGELFQQLPDGVRKVLDEIIPGGLNSSSRGAGDGSRGFFDEIGDQIRRKIDEILNETKERVRQIVQEVTSSTSDRVTNSVVGIAQNKLRLKVDQENSQNRSRGLSFSNPNDFIDNFINSSLEEVRPLVRGELKSVYDSILNLVPQDARRILISIVPGLEDPKNSQNNQNNQHNQYQNNQQNQYQNQYQNNQQNQYQTFQGGNNNQYQNPPQNLQGNINNGPYNRGIEQGDEEPRSRGLLSDIKNFAHQIKDTVKTELKTAGNPFTNRGDSEKLLEEFQAKAMDKIGRITTDLMNLLENKIMTTVSEELRTVAKDKLAKNISF